MTPQREIFQTIENMGQLFFMRNIIMEFKNPNLFLYTRTDRLKAICPLNLFKFGGLKIHGQDILIPFAYALYN